jgi:hypothetical protein
LVIAVTTWAHWGSRVSNLHGALLFGVPSLLVATALMRKLRFGWGPTLAIVLSLVLYVLYFGYTGYGDRNYDGPEQLRYIRHIARNGTLPEASACFVCHHPPLYYGIAAGCYQLAKLTGLVNAARGVQLFGVLTMFGFLVYAVLLLRRFLVRRSSMLLATALVAMWPYTIINSVRAHNDVLVSVFMLAGVYHLVRWHQGDGTRQLWFAGGLAALSLVTKSSGYILVAAIGLVALLRLWRGPGRLRQLRRMALPLVLLLVVSGGYAMRPRASRDAVGHSLLGSAYTIHPRDYVGNEPRNFVTFDVDSFLTEPYLLSRFDGSGRQYYWNHLVKSSLFATHNNVADAETAYRYNRRIAELLNPLLLAMIGYALAALLISKRSRRSRYAVVHAATACFVGFHVAFKALVPSAHHNDFRFVYPVLVFAALGYVRAVENFDERRSWLARAGRWMALTMLAGSVVYFLPKYDWVVRELPPKVLHHAEHNLKRKKKEGIPWDKRGNLVVARDEVVEVTLDKPRPIKQVEILVDHNDRYEVVLLSDGGATKRLVFGPRARELERTKNGSGSSKKPIADAVAATETAPRRMPLALGLGRVKTKKKPPAFKGLARYKRTLDAPLHGVRAVRVRALSGDHCYAIGQLVVR